MFYIRTDANETIATGHVMRCLSIAEAMKRQGEDTTFIIADHRSEELIASRGFATICLNSRWDDLDKEIDKLKEVIVEREIQTLLIDSYFVTESYLNELRKYTKIVYIDDLNKFIYPVDCLINYNVYAEELNYYERYKVAGLQDTQFILGCAYAPLRKEFSGVTRKINDRVSKILITSGGTDKYNVVGHILDMLEKQKWFSEMEYYVILGRFNRNKNHLEAQCEIYENIHLLSNVNNMADYMKLCDIAITAGGTTTYELFATGIPSIMYTLADNQLQIASTVSDKGFISWIGDIRDDVDTCMVNMISCLDELRGNSVKRTILSEKMQQIIDGNGCERLAKILSKM